jgi:hypothetical protein
LLHFAQDEKEEMLAIPFNRPAIELNVAVSLHHMPNQTAEILLNLLFANILQVVLGDLAEDVEFIAP